MPDNLTVRSMTITNPNGALAGIDAIYNSFHSDLYTSNFETHWTSGRAQINASVQYNQSNEGNYVVEQILRLLRPDFGQRSISCRTVIRAACRRSTSTAST